MVNNAGAEVAKQLDLTHGKQLSPLEWQGLLEEMEAMTGHQESFKERAMRKMKDQPLVPIGAAATVACLTMGLANLLKGDKKKQQYFMRGRVAAQGFTIAVIAFAMVSTALKDGPASKSSK